MATNEQVKLLVKSHFESEDRFRTTVLQIAASEASKGKANFARELKIILDSEKAKQTKNGLFKSHSFSELIYSSLPEQKLSELVTSDSTRNKIKRIIKEFKNQEKIKSHGLDNRRKILLVGNPGTGKTMTAAILAKELQLPLCTIMMDKMVTKYMGETSAKLRQIFDDISNCQGVYLFDEFDTIGGERSMDNDVGEIRRVLNTFLQLIEKDNSSSIIVSATNNPKLLDQALFRRFDDIIEYNVPDIEQILQLITNRLGVFKLENENYEAAANNLIGMSHAEIVQICNDAIKDAILNDEESVSSINLNKLVGERKNTNIRGD
jgi:AAA+ superfamily predicted ATPase